MRPRHAASNGRWRLAAAGVFGVLMLVAGLLAASTTGNADEPSNSSGPGGGAVSIERALTARRTIHLPPATAKPEPAPPSVADAPAVRPHEIFGYAPYWTLPFASGFDVNDLTTLAYFSVDVNPDGSISHAGAGWEGYQSQDLVNLVNRAHQAGDRVVLTATCFDQSALNAVTSDPSAPERLARSLIQLLEAKNLDGINLDFEGEGSGDQLGLDHLVNVVSAAVRATDPHWQVTMATYASSAGDPGGFYDIQGLAPSVDAFFVMAYDMNNFSEPSPTASLSGPTGFTDLDAVTQYTAAVPASKVILGVPFYGYDWPTTGPAMGDTATGSPTPLSYAQIASAGHPVYWDPATDTAWTSYQVDGQWHQTWFDNPTSMALKAQLASQYHLGGLGIWALGMDGNDPAMMAALTGNTSVIKDFQPDTGPVAPGQSSGSPGGATTSSSARLQIAAPATTQPAYSYSGVWDGKWITLVPADPASLPGNGVGTPAGTLGAFSTNDPADGCLVNGPKLAVTALSAEAGLYMAQARQPADCADGTWLFWGTRPGGSGGTTTIPPSSTTTSTTDPKSTTTTAAHSSTTIITPLSTSTTKVGQKSPSTSSTQGS
jgi:hypothetical protein